MRKLTTEEFITKANEIHGDTYGDIYGYNFVEYITCNEKVEIECKKHHIFLQTPNTHLKENVCPKCSESKDGNN